jgi:hypothetical protein
LSKYFTSRLLPFATRNDETLLWVTFLSLFSQSWKKDATRRSPLPGVTEKNQASERETRLLAEDVLQKMCGNEQKSQTER